MLHIPRMRSIFSTQNNRFFVIRLLSAFNQHCQHTFDSAANADTGDTDSSQCALITVSLN